MQLQKRPLIFSSYETVNFQKKYFRKFRISNWFFVVKTKCLVEKGAAWFHVFFFDQSKYFDVKQQQQRSKQVWQNSEFIFRASMW